ncbi:MAG: hypothetical protein NTZ17_14150 [Phycisphaerae bacterium]|nr:hypothetical protein [Phycisphaerae bacterium]
MGERRKKTQGGSDEGKAAGKGPRSRKARPNPNGIRDPDSGAARCGLSGQDATDTASTPQEPGQAPQAPLPGEFYQRAGRWWWHVKLPGEDKAKARPLKAEGAKAAAEDRRSAEKIAFEMWEHALQDDAARQTKMENTEKIERLKAQFLDKVRHFTELVETANAKIQAEAKARAEAEAKLAQITQAAGPKTQDGEQKAKEVEPPAPQATPPIREVETAPPEVVSPAVTATPPLQRAPESEMPPPAIQTGVCDCCGATGIAAACLMSIDSGQSLCPRCLTALRSDIARLDSDSLN